MTLPAGSKTGPIWRKFFFLSSLETYLLVRTQGVLGATATNAETATAEHGCKGCRVVASVAKQLKLNKREIAMKIRPLQDRVVVRRMEEETKTSGGIVLPGSAAEKPNQGEVVAVGTGKTLDNGTVKAVDVKVGDQIVFGQYSGSNTIKVDGEELLIMSESEIYGVI